MYFSFSFVPPGGEFAVTRLPLSERGGFNDIAHRPYIRVFTNTGTFYPSLG